MLVPLLFGKPLETLAEFVKIKVDKIYRLSIVPFCLIIFVNRKMVILSRWHLHAILHTLHLRARFATASQVRSLARARIRRRAGTSIKCWLKITTRLKTVCSLFVSFCLRWTGFNNWRQPCVDYLWLMRHKTPLCLNSYHAQECIIVNFYICNPNIVVVFVGSSACDVVRLQAQPKCASQIALLKYSLFDKELLSNCFSKPWVAPPPFHPPVLSPSAYNRGRKQGYIQLFPDTAWTVQSS